MSFSNSTATDSCDTWTKMEYVVTCLVSMCSLPLEFKSMLSTCCCSIVQLQRTNCSHASFLDCKGKTAAWRHHTKLGEKISVSCFHHGSELKWLLYSDVTCEWRLNINVPPAGKSHILVDFNVFFVQCERHDDDVCISWGSTWLGSLHYFVYFPLGWRWEDVGQKKEMEAESVKEQTDWTVREQEESSIFQRKCGLRKMPENGDNLNVWTFLTFFSKLAESLSP